MAKRGLTLIGYLLAIFNVIFALYLTIPLVVNFLDDTSIWRTLLDFLGLGIAFVFIGQAVGLFHIQHRHPRYFKQWDQMGIVAFFIFMLLTIFYQPHQWPILIVGILLLLMDHGWNRLLIRRNP